MELKWLEDLLVLLDEKSISRAADRRHVTQPAYSRRIRQLEDWLGIELVDRGTKPIGIRASAYALEDGVRDLVHRFYALRNSVHEGSERVTFVAQHSLAISRFPKLVRVLKRRLPGPSYRVVPADHGQCEALFYGDGDLLLCYESAQRRFDFDSERFGRHRLGRDELLPVASPTLNAQLGELAPSSALPLLLYQRGGFFADLLAAHCLPAVNRDYRVEVVCESAFSASLKEMALADMGVAWLARDIIDRELADGRLVSLAGLLGRVELDVLLYFRDEPLAARVGDVIAGLRGRAA